MRAYKILQEVNEFYRLETDNIVNTEKTIAGLNEDDFYEICDYLASKKINHETDRRSMTGLWIIDILI